MSGNLRQSNLYLERGSRDDAVKYYGWRTGRGVKIALITTNQAVKFGTRVSDKYEWNQVAACFKTKFIVNAWENLVIIMTDGKYLVLKGSIAELVEVEGPFTRSITESTTGGRAFDEIYTKFSGVAKVKHISRIPQTCLKEIPYITLCAFILTATTFGLFGITLITLSATLLLLAFLLYELYCLRNLKNLAKNLTTSGITENTTATRKIPPGQSAAR